MDIKLEDLKHVKQFETLAANILDQHGKYYFSVGASCSIPRGNEEGLQKYRIRPQVLRDVSKTDLTCEILKSSFPNPIGVAPTGHQFLAHKDAEIATALGSAKEDSIYIMSCVSSTTIENISEMLKSLPRKVSIWMQVYIFKDRSVTLDLLRRAENSGFSAIVVTVDSPISGQWKTDLPEGFATRTEDKYTNLSSACYSLQDSSLTFKDLKWLTKQTKLPVIVKGILTGEDALLAIQCGATAIYVSNHGERQIEKVIPTIDALEEVIQAVEKRDIDVYFDGGIRHGSDIFIAIAMGAKAVFVGRPIIWGLTIAGEKGVRQVLRILKEEFLSTMKLAGARSVKDIHKYMIQKTS